MLNQRTRCESEYKQLYRLWLNAWHQQIDSGGFGFSGRDDGRQSGGAMARRHHGKRCDDNCHAAERLHSCRGGHHPWYNCHVIATLEKREQHKDKQ